MSKKIAVRAFGRIMKPIADRMEAGAACDRMFDAGEWSDAASAREAERVEEEVAARIAPRFGMNGAELLDAVWVASHIEQDHFMMAVQS